MGRNCNPLLVEVGQEISTAKHLPEMISSSITSSCCSTRTLKSTSLKRKMGCVAIFSTSLSHLASFRSVHESAGAVFTTIMVHIFSVVLVPVAFIVIPLSQFPFAPSEASASLQPPLLYCRRLRECKGISVNCSSPKIKARFQGNGSTKAFHTSVSPSVPIAFRSSLSFPTCSETISGLLAWVVQATVFRTVAITHGSPCSTLSDRCKSDY